MTKPKTSGKCPICGKVLQVLAKHLRQKRNVKNTTERTILNGLATGRTTVPPGPCPLPNCSPHLLNVEKHIMAHKDLSRRRLERERRKLKMQAAIALLAELRATNPVPEMVSTLDVDDSGEGSSTSNPNPCQNPSCVQRVQKLTAEIQQLKEQVVSE